VERLRKDATRVNFLFRKKREETLLVGFLSGTWNFFDTLKAGMFIEKKQLK